MRFGHTRTLRRILLTLALSTGLSGMTVTASMALEPGVHADPESPAAKEYALPLAQARQTGHGLFGAGIRRTRGSQTSGANQAGRPSATPRPATVRRNAGAGTSTKARAAAPGLPTAVRDAVRAPTRSGGGSLLALLGGGAGVLLVGVLGATLFKGRRSIGVAGR